MSDPRPTFVEHVAFRVKDIDWHIRFFSEALGMPVREVDGAFDKPRQAWLVGGIQLIADADLAGPEGRLAHLGVMAEDLEATLAEIRRWGATPLPQGHNWVALPDGLNLELIQASGDSVARILAVNPRA
ncbi:MAG: VOC family protein [Betaproteobacteria bacterium]|nr:VOC family protein [Betaproteobacteria bacterium]